MSRRSAGARARAFVFVAALGASLGTARGAGGHFAVDDAALLDPGQCQVEVWLERDPGPRTLSHVGPDCRVGALELGFNVDHLQGDVSSTLVGPQLKWAHAIGERASVGAVALASWSSRGARLATTGAYAIVTLQVAESVWLHGNGGRDWFADTSPTSRAGVSLEWHAAPAWSLIGEHFRQFGLNASRLGVRWQASPALSIDLSRAGGTGTTLDPWWTIGANWTFAPRPR